MIAEGAIQALKGGRQPTVLPSCDAFDHQHGMITVMVTWWHPNLCDDPSSRIELKAPSAREKSCLALEN